MRELVEEGVAVSGQLGQWLNVESVQHKGCMGQPRGLRRSGYAWPSRTAAMS